MRALPALLLLSSSVLAQSTPDVVFHSAAEIASTETALLADARSAPTRQASKAFDQLPSSYMLLVSRLGTGEAEQHDLWADQMIVQSGTMTVVTGGTMIGKHPLDAKGEFRGTGLQGGTPHVLHAGDLLRVPAGIPHWSTLAPGQTVKYIAIKEK